MRYRKFEIRNYRAIRGPLEINLKKNSLLPIIGVNECGKTTILHALLAFDYVNDSLNKGGRHLQDVMNLYDTNPKVPTVSAEVEMTKGELKSVIRDLQKDEEWKNNSGPARYAKFRSSLGEYLTITRNLETLEYSLLGIPSAFNDTDLNSALGRQIVSRLPYILYFDDFHDSFPEKIEITKDKSEGSDWLAILDTLFRKTDQDFSLFSLAEKEERQRKTILSKVTRKLNRTLTDEWKNFRLDESDALQIQIEFEQEADGDKARSYLKFNVVEIDIQGDEHFFFVRDRSKGFYWFFNFVMKLEFNPKVIQSGDVDAIYVLDEPGSYLHASAQERLCRKLRYLSATNHVIYCTHSHHLLNPEVVPLSAVRVAEKSREGAVSLTSIYAHKGTITENRLPTAHGCPPGTAFPS